MYCSALQETTREYSTGCRSHCDDRGEERQNTLSNGILQGADESLFRWQRSQRTGLGHDLHDVNLVVSVLLPYVICPRLRHVVDHVTMSDVIRYAYAIAERQELRSIE